MILRNLNCNSRGFMLFGFRVRLVSNWFMVFLILIMVYRKVVFCLFVFSEYI